VTEFIVTEFIILNLPKIISHCFTTRSMCLPVLVAVTVICCIVAENITN